MNSKKLGFGLMRLPLLDAGDVTKINYDEMQAMADSYMAAGFNYFDTAAPYHGGSNSEIAFRECVAKRFPRESYTITDKLSFFIVKKAEELDDFFEGQLKRCGVEYFDYYLLHSMKEEYIALAEEIGAFDFVQRKKAEGKIKHIGFSFHDKAEVLDEFLTKHPEMEYVQLQINYADWENPEVQSRACYETAVKHGKQVLVMEPVKGGLLVNVPDEVRALFNEAEPNMSAASWAVRFAASLENVAMVLSGMSNIAQMEDNLSYMKEFKPLTERELGIINKAREILDAKETIACTSCRYCVDGCPQKIAIPEYFRLMNDISKFGKTHTETARQHYTYYIQTMGNGKASDCIGCRQCEEHCPQRLNITKYLEDAAATLE